MLCWSSSVNVTLVPTNEWEFVAGDFLPTPSAPSSSPSHLLLLALQPGGEGWHLLELRGGAVDVLSPCSFGESSVT